MIPLRTLDGVDVWLSVVGIDVMYRAGKTTQVVMSSGIRFEFTETPEELLVKLDQYALENGDE